MDQPLAPAAAHITDHACQQQSYRPGPVYRPNVSMSMRLANLGPTAADLRRQPGFADVKVKALGSGAT
jgi:hypothetical protein